MTASTGNRGIAGSRTMMEKLRDKAVAATGKMIHFENLSNPCIAAGNRRTKNPEKERPTVPPFVYVRANAINSVRGTAKSRLRGSRQNTVNSPVNKANVASDDKEALSAMTIG